MYQTEANWKSELADQLPERVTAFFAELKGQLLYRTVLPWGEHCTECVWPTCYSSCELYSPRSDGDCRRFVDGMVRVECPDAINGYLLKIRFKQWGKLWTPGNLHLLSPSKARRREDRDYRLGEIIHQLPLPAPVTSALAQKRYSFKKHVARRPGHDGSPTSLLLECFNPGDRTVSLSLTLRSLRRGTIPYQKLIPLSPGFRRVRIPASEIVNVADLAAPFGIELLPADCAQETTLFFGLMDFVQELEPAQLPSKPVKCIVWDLDNTVWDGVLAEVGTSALQLKPRMAEIMEAIDKRGILQSIASKNNYEQAMKAVAGFHLDHLFLYPQVSWSPKSSAVQAIAQQLNIGLDSVLFVDDSEFELEEVRSFAPEVRCLHAREYDTVLDLPACQLPVTAETGNRRMYYQTEENRKQLAASFKSDYRAFLKDCGIALTITMLREDNLDRVHELTQRTNQMNFSGTRYTRELLSALLNESDTDTYVLRCEDRFGSYGVVGFAVVDRREPRLTDLMFSCRIQAKRVEHAFLSYILRTYREASGTDFYANFRRTPRNEASGQVFADLGLVPIGICDGVTSLMFPNDTAIPEDGIISVRVERQNLTVEHLV